MQVKLIILSKVLDESRKNYKNDKLVKPEVEELHLSYKRRQIGAFSHFFVPLDKIQQKIPCSEELSYNI